MNRFGKPILFVVLFELIQLFVSLVAMVWTIVTTPGIRDVAVSGDKEAVTSVLMSALSGNGMLMGAMVVSSVLSILIMMWPFGEFRLLRDLKPSGIGLKASAVAIVGSLAGAMSLNILTEYMDLPDLLSENMDMMLDGVLGCLVVSVIAPIAEEVVFRASILGYMLRKGVDRWTAIIISGLLFGLMHLNPAQVPFAAVVGVMLGIIYYKTGNIILTSIIHVINNSVSVILSKTMGADCLMSDLLGGAWGAFAVLCVSSVLCVYLFKYFWRSTADREYAEKTEDEVVGSVEVEHVADVQETSAVEEVGVKVDEIVEVKEDGEGKIEEKKGWKEKYGKAILAMLTFIGVQLGLSVVFMLMFSIYRKMTGQEVSMGQMDGGLMTTVTVVTLFVSSIVSIVLMMWPFKLFKPGRDLKPSGMSGLYVILTIGGAVAGSIALNIIVSLLDVPDLLEQKMPNMAKSFLGAISIAVVGPIAEEVVFRASILGYMLRKGVSAWKAIIIAALMFGLMHINPAQVVFATLLGVIFCVIYYKTGNILLTILIHIMNNSLAVVTMLLAGDAASESKLEWSVPVVIVALMTGTFCVVALKFLWKGVKSRRYVGED